MGSIRKGNKWIVAFFMFAFVLMMSVSGQAAFSASVSGAAYPESIKSGQQYSIKGTVVASEVIKKAVVSVYNSAGTVCVQKYTDTPGSTVFNIAKADPYITFDKLPVGQYYYLVSVYNANGDKKRVITAKFNITGTAEKVVKSGFVYPDTLTKGKEFQISGTLTSTFTMKEVVVTIYNSTGKKCLQKYTANVNSKTYNVKKADPFLYFDQLKAGTYFYRISVYNAAGNKTRVVDKQFTVVAPASITIVNPVPSANVTIKKGQDYQIGGTIKSTYALNYIQGTIFDQAGNYVYRKTVNPGIKSYSLKGSVIDTALHFEKLPVGTYTYKVFVKDIKGNEKTLVNRKITVKAASTPSTPTTPTTSDDITILYCRPNEDVTIGVGTVYQLGGVIVGRYSLSNVTLTLTNAIGNKVVNKTVKPGSKVYIIDDSALDAAVPFEALGKGTYVLKIVATDAKGYTKTVLSKKIKIV